MPGFCASLCLSSHTGSKCPPAIEVCFDLEFGEKESSFSMETGKPEKGLTFLSTAPVL